MNYKLLIVGLFSLVFSLSSNAHTDRILKQEENKLIGLPEKYAPAVFSWENKVLRIGDNQIDLNAFENVVPLQQEYEIRISSSWYHKGGGLPPYIGINLQPKDRTFRYEILLNLETLELIKVTIRYRIYHENYIDSVYHELKVRDYDLKQIKSRTRKVK